MIKSVCCICGVQYGEKSSEGTGDQISHGYCQRCMLAEMAKIEAYAESEVRP